MEERLPKTERIRKKLGTRGCDFGGPTKKESNWKGPEQLGYRVQHSKRQRTMAKERS